MNKYLVFEDGKFNFGGDVVYVELDGGGDIILFYADKQIGLKNTAGSFVAADKVAIEDALVAVWGQSYTNATISVTLSRVINTVA
tara:strand:- start:4909 stop:5163 length:255 start_codon:yes stop_codon:yes gene_type:complete